MYCGRVEKSLAQSQTVIKTDILSNISDYSQHALRVWRTFGWELNCYEQHNITRTLFPRAIALHHYGPMLEALSLSGQVTKTSLMKTYSSRLSVNQHSVISFFKMSRSTSFGASVFVSDGHLTNRSCNHSIPTLKGASTT